MKIFKRLICILVLPLLLAGCARHASYEQTKQLYQALTTSIVSMTEEERWTAYAEVFDNIAQGSLAEQDQFAVLAREIINDDDVVFENEEVFNIARDYATVCTRLADGDRDWGVQELKVKCLFGSTAQLDFPYWGEMWYSVEMIQEGDQWVTGEFTDPYQGELGKYLMTVQFHDAEPSMKFMEQYPGLTDHKLYISRLGSDYEMTMHIIGNASHGYNVYIGSDEPFWVEEQSSVRLNRLVGTVSVELHFGE